MGLNAYWHACPETPARAQMNAKRRYRWRWIVGAGIALAVVVATLAKRDGASTDATLHTVTVKRSPIVESVVATGKIEPKTKVEIKSKVNGIVKFLFVDAGDAVQEGQVVAEIDKEVAEARVKEARALLLGAEAASARARVEVSSTERDYAEKELARRTDLRRRGVVSAEELERAKRDFDMAEIRYQSARANLQIAEAQVAQAQAGLERAENELRYATIVSPLTGIVLSRDVDVGSGVSAVGTASGFGTTVMTVGDTSELHVVGLVDEIDIGRVRLDQPARIRVESFPGRVFEGRVTKISPQGSEKDKVINFEVKVSIIGDMGGLRPMMTADAEAVVAEKSAVLVIPEAAVIRENDRTFVERPIGKGEKEKVPVTLGIGNGAEVEVLAGLEEGTVIVGP